MKNRYKLAIFDMDGTILDTVADITTAMNLSLADEGLPGHSTAETLRMQGWGIKVFTDMATPEGTPDDVKERVAAGFAKYYKIHNADETRPYDGIPELMREIKNRGMKIAVVSNKLDFAVHQLCDIYFPGLVDFSVGFKEGLSRKPAPDSVYLALDALGISKKDAVYIGDSETDVETAVNSGLEYICVLWGFRTREEMDRSGGRNYADTPTGILNYL